MFITEAEQNRLIVENTNLVTPIAAQYRGRKGIPFEDLVAEGMAGLVLAARVWEPTGAFAAYAPHKIRSAIVDFIDKWQEFVAFEDASSDRDAEDIFLEWDVWPHAAPYESWTSLAATPEELVGAFQEMAASKAAFSAAMLSLRKRDRAMVTARFLRTPHQTLEAIAREHRVSYARTVFIIDRALRSMRTIVETIERKANSRRTSPVIPPARRPPVLPTF